MGELRFISRNELNDILKKHKMWLNREPGGERADLREADLNWVYLRRAYIRGADLRGANLSEADLRGADLSEGNLRWAYLKGADLVEANLSEANLRGADLRGAYLNGADLRGADLRGADLRGAFLIRADLTGADLRGADLRLAFLGKANFSETKLDWPLVCPEKGSFVGYKKCRDNLIVKLEIPEDALRSSATTRKCRCSKARVLSITNLDGSDVNVEYAVSEHDPSFPYKVGKIVEVNNFDTNRWNECSTGIHFFMTREEAVEYNY